MGITFRHDAAGVVPPSNSTTRKYGQQLVLQQQQQDQQTRMQQQQQKYQGYQAGLDRLFYAGRQLSQNQFQLDRDKAQNEFAMRQQQAKDFEAARGRMDAYAKDALNNPDLSHELRQKIQNLISGKLTVLGGGFDAPAQQEFLDQYNSQLAALLSEVPPPKPKPTRDEQLKAFLGEQGYDTYGHLPWMLDGKGGFTVSKEILEQQQKEREALEKSQQQPRNAAEVFRTDPKIRKQYYDDAVADLQGGDASKPVTREKANRRAMELYDIDQKSFNPQPTPAPAMDGGAPSIPGESRSILESAPAVQDDAEFHAAMTKKGYKLMTPTDGRSPFYYKDANQPEPDTDFHRSMTAKGYKLMTPTDGTSPYYYRDGAPPSEQPQAGAEPPRGAPPSQVPPPTTKEMQQYKKGREEKQQIARKLGYSEKQISEFNDMDLEVIRQMAERIDSAPPSPAIAPPEQPTAQQASTGPTPAAQPPVAAPALPQAAPVSPPAPQKVKVDGKPLAVTPGTLTPQETEARQKVMEMPREQRIAALLPYDPNPELKGKTVDQILNDPANKAKYDELSKQGLTTGNYREDMLAHLDDVLQNNVLNGGGTPRDAYVGMRADEITDPKAKAEIAKLPRPKSMDDRNMIRSGQLYVDPEGVIRARS